jgi:hypothetical protein
LKGNAITVEGLRSTMADARARIIWADGMIEIERQTPEVPTLILAGAHATATLL